MTAQPYPRALCPFCGALVASKHKAKPNGWLTLRDHDSAGKRCQGSGKGVGPVKTLARGVNGSDRLPSHSRGHAPPECEGGGNPPPELSELHTLDRAADQDGHDGEWMTSDPSGNTGQLHADPIDATKAWATTEKAKS